MLGQHRVAVTGMGLVTAIGCDVPSFAASLLAGRSGVEPLPGPPDIFPKSSAAARVAAFAPPDGWLGWDRSVQFAVAAARGAFADAGRPRLDPERTGVAVASSKGGILAFCSAHCEFLAGERGSPGGAPPWLLSFLPSTPAAAVAADLGCRGPTTCPVAACAAGSHAVIEGALMVARGEADAAFAGAAEASICPLILAGFGKLGVLAADGVCRPFDRGRSGFVIGEGAAVLMLERLDGAAARGARIYAEVAGCARGADAGGLTAFSASGRSVAGAVGRAMASAGIGPEALGYVNAHATGTRSNDVIEARALRAALGERAASVPVSGTKPMTGHLLGAAGAVEAAVCILAISEGIIPPTLNLSEPDPECALDLVLAGRHSQVATAMNVSFGFGGQIGVIVLRARGR